MRTTIKQVLMKRDKMTSAEADEQIADFMSDIEPFIEEGNLTAIEEELLSRFGLEPDYIDEIPGLLGF